MRCAGVKLARRPGVVLVCYVSRWWHVVCSHSSLSAATHSRRSRRMQRTSLPAPLAPMELPAPSRALVSCRTFAPTHAVAHEVAGGDPASRACFCAKLRSERSRRRAVVRRPPLRAGCDIGMRYDIMPPQNSTRPWLALLDLAAADQGAPSAPYSKSPANRGQCSHEARRWSCDAPLTPAATASGSNARAAESRRHLPGRGPSHDGILKRGGGAWSAHSTWADEA